MDSVNSWASYLKVLLILAGLLCACWVVLQMLSRRLGVLGRQGRAGVLEVIDSVMLEPRKSVYVVRAGPKYMALAASESGIELLLELGSEGMPPAKGEKAQ
jgi:flagellar biogenesis protein FliO